MTEDRIHRTRSDDGTEIAARVHGDGPPLVFVHGGLGDDHLGWSSVVPWLTDQFTCYTMSTRGRGLSGHSTDFSPDRIVQDIIAVVESLGEPAGLVGHSGGALQSLAAAQHTTAISAVAAYEPPVIEVISQDMSTRFADTVAQVGEVAAGGRLAQAARTWMAFATNDDELAALSAEVFEAQGPNVPIQLQQWAEGFEADGPSPTAPSQLARITAPVLLLHGTQSEPHPWITDGVRHVADHVPDVQVREITGAGHIGPVVQPESVATQLSRFFTAIRHRGQAFGTDPRQ